MCLISFFIDVSVLMSSSIEHECKHIVPINMHATVFINVNMNSNVDMIASIKENVSVNINVSVNVVVSFFTY